MHLYDISFTKLDPIGKCLHALVIHQVALSEQLEGFYILCVSTGQPKFAV